MNSAESLNGTKKYFTTGQAAKICNVAPKTVQNWFDSGQLRGFRIPTGHRERRIPKENLIRFMKINGIPLGELEEEITTRILVLSQDIPLIAVLRQEAEITPRLKIQVAESSFEVGLQLHDFQPDCLVCDFLIGSSEARNACIRIRQHFEYREMIIIVLVPDDVRAITFDYRFKPNDILKKPFDCGLLFERIKTLLSQPQNQTRS